MKILYAARSDVGLKREDNEDAYIIVQPGQVGALKERVMLFALADGLGGHPCGEVASKMACNAMEGFLDELEGDPELIEKRLLKRFHEIDENIRTLSGRKRACRNMGTTLSAVVFSGHSAIIAHVGDSRVYRLRDDRMEQITNDHTFLQEMIESGLLAPEDSAVNHFRNKLTNTVGTDEPLELVDTQRLEIVAGDRFLLSSDGLHDTVAFCDIKNTLQEVHDPEKAASHLLSLAIKNGGHDNITIIVIHFSYRSMDINRTSPLPQL